MQPDLWFLYSIMLRSRLFEEAIAKLWYDGLISGEMHLGTGEEGIIAGIVSQLRDGDAMALDHRPTAAFLMRGVEAGSVIAEILGRQEGLGRGLGGHMHLFSRQHLATSSGIVGASGPAACGFALSAQYRNTDNLAVAFFGEGAINQGALLESFNLASVWNLPVLFVCKDDGWSITTGSEEMTGGEFAARIKGFGIPFFSVDGSHVNSMWEVARNAIALIREGGGPAFIHASCTHTENHFLGYQLKRLLREPAKELPDVMVPLSKSFLSIKGASFAQRSAGMKKIFDTVLLFLQDSRQNKTKDPILVCRRKLKSEPDRLELIESQAKQEVGEVISSVLEGIPA